MVLEVGVSESAPYLAKDAIAWFDAPGSPVKIAITAKRLSPPQEHLYSTGTPVPAGWDMALSIEGVPERQGPCQNQS
jgi:hypothetical protein